MFALANLTALVGYLLPLFGFVSLRSNRDRRPWQIALDIVLAIPLDLLLVLCLARAMSLEWATVVSRAGYALVWAGILVYRHIRRQSLPAWPSALGKGEVARVAACAVVAASLSVPFSRWSSMWDRHWHIPLAAAIRGQALPFGNTFNAKEVLHYHFTGDVAASMLQTLSLAVIHSSLALSVAHDIYFALIGVVLGLFLVEWGYRSFSSFVWGPLAVLLTGPVTLFRNGDLDWAVTTGYNLNCFWSVSFRPHTSLAALLMLGFVGAILVRLGRGGDLPLRQTAPALIGCTAGLAISDESSLGILGLTLGLCWLFTPSVVHRSRAVGVLVFACLAAALVVPNLAFAAALAPGGQHHTFSMVPWRSPGFYTSELPLTTVEGRRMLAFDLFPQAFVAAGVVLHAVSRRAPGRGTLAAFFVILFGVSCLVLTRLDMDRQPVEIHRFMTAALFLGPLVGLAILARRFPSAQAPEKPAWYVSAIIGTGLFAGAVSTLAWLLGQAPGMDYRHGTYFAEFDHYHTNCRKEVGSTLFAKTRWMYISKPLWYLLAGCRPVFSPGVIANSGWKQLTIGVPMFNKEAVAALRKAVPPGSSVSAYCPRRPDPPDPMCADAEAAGKCRVVGPHAEECLLSAEMLKKLSP